jgi:hypothetical protein
MGNMVGDAGHVNIASYNRKVLLTGEVRDEAMKANVEREVRGIENVSRRHQRTGRGRPVELYLAFVGCHHHRQREGQPGRNENDLGHLVQGRDRARYGLPDGPA